MRGLHPKALGRMNAFSLAVFSRACPVAIPIPETHSPECVGFLESENDCLDGDLIQDRSESNFLDAST